MKTKKAKLTLSIGDRIFNHGDMANSPHFGTITDILYDLDHVCQGDCCRITPDADSGYEHGPYWIPASMISSEYLGHGGTRIVTEAEYKRWHEAQHQNFLRWASEVQAKHGEKVV